MTSLARIARRYSHQAIATAGSEQHWSRTGSLLRLPFRVASNELGTVLGDAIELVLAD